MFTDDDCKIALKLDEIHDWTHLCLKSLSKEQLHDAHLIGQKILDMLNEIDAHNGVKFIAVFEALSVGSDVIHWDMHMLNADYGKGTIQ